MKTYLSKIDRDSILEKLNKQQKEFVDKNIRVKKSDRFATVLGSLKGKSSKSEAEANEIAQNWMLVDYIDNGKISAETKCLCGRPLRYVYVVQNRITQEVINLGITHLQEHTNIPPEVVKDIVKHMHMIDSELDEFLILFSKNINMNLEMLPEVDYPPRMKELIELNLPLSHKEMWKYQELNNVARKKAALAAKDETIALQRKQRIDAFFEKHHFSQVQRNFLFKFFNDDRFANEIESYSKLLDEVTNVGDQIYIPQDFDYSDLGSGIPYFINLGLPLRENQLTELKYAIKKFQDSQTFDNFKPILSRYYKILQEMYGLRQETIIELLGRFVVNKHEEQWRELITGLNDDELAKDNGEYVELFKKIAHLNHDSMILCYFSNGIPFTRIMRSKIKELVETQRDLEIGQSISQYEQVIVDSPDRYLAAFVLDLFTKKRRMANTEMRRAASAKNLNSFAMQKVLDYLVKNKVLKVTESAGIIKEYVMYK